MLETCFFNDGSINNEEFEKVVKQYHRIILRYVRMYYLPGGDYWDMYQWGLIGLYKAVCHFDQTRGSSFRLMAEMNIKSTIKSAVTMHNRKKHYFLNEAISLNCLTDTPGITVESVFLNKSMQDDPAAIVIEEESADIIDEELSKILSRLEKRVVDLYIAGYKQREISQVLGLKEKVVDNAIQRARAKVSLRLRTPSNLCRQDRKYGKA